MEDRRKQTEEKFKSHKTVCVVFLVTILSSEQEILPKLLPKLLRPQISLQKATHSPLQSHTPLLTQVTEVIQDGLSRPGKSTLQIMYFPTSNHTTLNNST